MNVLSNRLLSTSLAALLALGATAAHAAGEGALRISLTSDTAQLKSSDDVTVNVRVTNVSAEAVSVPKRNLPSKASTVGLFSITRDGAAVPYVGALVKRGPLTAADYVRIDAGASLEFEVELSSLYDLSASGVYQIRYEAQAVPTQRAVALRAVALRALTTTDAGAKRAQAESLAQTAQSQDLASNAIALTVTADTSADSLRATSALARIGGGEATPQFSSSISFIGCSNTRQTQIKTALSSAESYANNSKSYLNAGTRGARLTTWFGTYNSGRYTTLKNHYTKISDALTNKPMQFDCSTCPKDPELADAYAYVYPDRHYRIYLCNSFWAAPNTGTDSRAGTIIHETSHFDIVAGTDDNAYGQSACKSLARSNPARAVANADSHEYFAENTPAQN